MASPERAWADAREKLLGETGASEGTGFGKTPGVKVGGKIAAMYMNERLVVKLPAERCRQLETDAGAEPLRVGKRVMREWVSVPVGSDWSALALEAAAFVRTGR